MLQGTGRVADRREDICNLLGYAEELLRITEKTVSDLSKDAIERFHERDLVKLEGIAFDEAEDTWIRVGRLRENAPPEPDPMFSGWITGLGAVTEAPRLMPKRMLTVSLDEASELLEAGLALAEDIMAQRGEKADPLKADVLLRVENMPEFAEAFRAWRDGPWTAWAEAERPRRRSIDTYNRLFVAYQRMVAAGDDTPIECVMGVGLARWQHPDGRIDAPLVEAMVELDVDETDGAIVVRPREQPPRLTLRAFDDLGLPNVARVQRAAGAKLAELDSDPDLGFSPFRRDSFDLVLRSCQAGLAPDAIYEAHGDVPPAAERPLPHFDDRLRVSDSWVLYVRQRSVDFRCEDIRRLQKQIKDSEGEDGLPPPVVQLASKPKDTKISGEEIDLEDDSSGRYPDAPATVAPSTGPSGGGGGSGEGRSDRALFLPLPYNDDQSEIIRKLEDPATAGVVVQGPPGTGKTHTIANIICHYMARGRRVLVTARSPEALTAIQSKMPESIRDLAIAVIHSDREGGRQLEQAVDILSRQVASIDKAAYDRERRDKEQRLATVRDEAERLDREIRATAEMNLLAVGFRGDSLLPMDLSARVEAERATHRWFEDTLDIDDRSEPRFGDNDIAEARAICTRLGADLAYPAAALPDPAALPGTAALLAALASLARDTETASRAASGDLPFVSLAVPGAAEAIRDIHAWLEALGAWFDEVSAGGHAWVLVAYEILLDARAADRAAKQALRDLCADWAMLQAEGRSLVIKGIETSAPPGDQAFDTAVEKLARGEKPFGLFAASTLKAQLASVRVAGAAPSVKPPAPAEWQVVKDFRAWQRQLQAFIGRWNAAAPVMGLSPLPTDWEAGRGEVLRLGSLVERLRIFHEEAPRRLTVIAALFPHGVDAREVVVLGKVAVVREALAANMDRGGAAEARAIREALRRQAANHPALPFHQGIAAICGMLGELTGDVRELAEAWGEVAEEAARLATLRADRERIETIAASVAASGAPRWAGRLLSEVPDGPEDALTPPSWSSPWEWARAAGFVARISDRAALARMSAKRTELEDEQHRLLAEIVRLRTFIGLKQGITERIASALAKFAVAVRRIGAGTGRSAARHRRAGREAAFEAAEAVPCWILPEWRVAEQLPSALGRFDLVVVDEASQSDITSLPVVLRGKKLLVVGDDKQVSPSAVGIEERLAVQLRETYLRGMPIASYLDPASSLYDLASMTFPGSVTMLREHFRCVEPIIRFSGRFYPRALVPLRLPTASERIDPPLVDVYVSYGRKVRDTNPAEAEWIADEIERISADPTMAKRTIGAISLIGDKQAKLLQDRLSERLGAEAMVRHRIMCGNAATFQGQERDIIFLSMVACPDTARAQTARTMEQRFNVAMSRARDRLYLVRSVRASDLPPADLKRAVIEHFQSPMGEAVVAQATDVLASCDSDFEREVGRRLLERGYRLRAQVPVGGFRIDFVVEGDGDRRLAVELDGDRFHGPDRWADDLRRQRALERTGWVFWRCWGSHWLADPEGCFSVSGAPGPFLRGQCLAESKAVAEVRGWPARSLVPVLALMLPQMV